MDTCAYCHEAPENCSCRDQPEQTAALLTKIKEQEAMLNNYRRLVGKLATQRDKGAAWYIAKSWAPFWREMAFDLKTEAEQKAFLFD